ncbi:MAG: hypothetical protein A3J74_02770 [Elusimicrobia bacterium RIFCSPHIGHO2_02_FULL_57_9]|nr:MAG: hypothetical protein A3J74_02770 [Elusimicrobia bacterium RIFCSPHIGHO2_02_FULL_57_9]
MRRWPPPDWAWVVLAGTLRLAFALKIGDRFIQIDEIGYDAPAWQLASTGVLGTEGTSKIVPPVPSTFFALFFYLSGHNKLFPRLGQALVGAWIVWCIGRMTKELTGNEKAGRLALAISAVYPFFIYYSGMLMSETIYIAALVPGLWWLCASLSESRRICWQAPAAGFALGLAALSRAEAAPSAIIIWLACAAACAKKRWPWRAWALAVLFWAIPLSIWAARNKATAGIFKLDTHGGMTMLHGTVLFEQNEQDTSLAMKTLKQMPFYQQAQGLPNEQRDNIYLREALNFMFHNPGLTLAQWTRKFVNFWRLYPRIDKQYHETIHSHPGAGLNRAALVIISLFVEPFLILGGFWGLWLLRSRWSELFPLLLFLAGTMMIHVVSVSQMRYRLPVMPILIMASAHWACARYSTKR